MYKVITNEIIRAVWATQDIAFNPTHSRLSLPIINRIYKKMQHGIKFDDIKVCDDFVIDGHHRYVASILANVNIIKNPCPKTSATVDYEWVNVEFVDEEWDTEDKIQHLNRLDAKYNDIPLEEIEDIIKND